jgi:hypothetical protein
MAGENSINQLKEVIGTPDVERSQQIPNNEKPVQSVEQASQLLESNISKEGRADSEGVSAVSASVAVNPPIAVSPEMEARRQKIEGIMASNLAEAYQALDPASQAKFKAVGEKTAKEINQLLNEAKIKVNKIINLIKFWLSILPGMNKFFLEKEAKIKTDAIIQLKKGGEQ